MFDKKYREIRVSLLRINKEYMKKNISFFIKMKVGRQFKDRKHNETNDFIMYDKTFSYYKINFNKDDTYIKITQKEVTFHEKYENFQKNVIDECDLLKEIIAKLRKI